MGENVTRCFSPNPSVRMFTFLLETFDYAPRRVMGLLALVCAGMLRRFDAGMEGHSHVWFRWFNEIPVLLLTATVILVVVKPF